MQIINVNASQNYDVHIGAGILSVPGNFPLKHFADRTVMIASDDAVAGIYGKQLETILAQAGIRTLKFVFPHGEQSKNLKTYSNLVDAMFAGRMTRSDLIIALGGGVVGDIAGFAAATYQRGVDFIQIPTTLLAAVDSSVGGKTGVDLEGGKNQIGVFHQPIEVICDTDTLKTLPEAEYQNGCAEVIKYAMIGSEKLFLDIDAVPVSEQYENVISKCVAMKRDFVEQDEFDLGIRMLLNFGHTIGHAIEVSSHYSIPHGKAVAIGMAVMTKAAEEMGHCARGSYDELVLMLKQYDLPFESPYTADQLAGIMMTDKKSQGNLITLVVPEKIGKCVPMKISKTEIPEWLRAGGI